MSIEYDFRLSTTDGYQFKVLSEILHKNMTEANFVVTEHGLRLREVNEKQSVIIDIDIPASNVDFEAPTERLVIGFTCQHLYKMFSCIKKKDKLVIYKLKGSDQLAFNIHNAEKDRNKDAAIRIKTVKESMWDMETFPNAPVTTIPASEWQRMCKSMASASKKITVKVQKHGVLFAGGTHQLYDLSDKYGRWSDDDEVVCEKTFVSTQLGRLDKFNGLSTQVRLFSSGKEEAIKFVVPIGHAGTLSACVIEESA